MKPQLIKIGLMALCAGISIAPLAVSAQTTAASPSPDSAIIETHPKHRSNYGLLGLLGLLGLAGLMRKRHGVHAPEPAEVRPKAPPGSYVSDLKNPNDRNR